MNPRYCISTKEPPPPGFTAIPELHQRHLRRDVFILYTEDLETFSQQFEHLFQKLFGVVFTPDGSNSLQRLGPALWHMSAPAEAEFHLQPCHECLMYVLSDFRRERKNNELMKIENERAQVQLDRLTHYFSAVQEKMESDVKEQAQWTSRVLSHLVSYASSVLQSTPVENFPRAITEFFRDQCFHFRGAALLEPKKNAGWKTTAAWGAEVDPPASDTDLRTEIRVEADTVYVPLFLAGRYCLLAMINPPHHHLSDAEFSFLSLFSSFIASIHEKRMTEYELLSAKEQAESANKAKSRALVKLQELSRTDQLTGCLNRWGFVENMDYELRRIQRINSPLSLIMFDIDHFKHINDTQGHELGDRVLQKLAAITRNTIRDVDVFTRWGGEEFMILTPDTDAEGARVLAERIRETVVWHQFPGVGNVTVSLGVAPWKKGDSRNTMISRADKYMYLAKQNGRNRVEGGYGEDP